MIEHDEFTEIVITVSLVGTEPIVPARKGL
jgi:hypothetical protein